jgi:hypothetical protein
MITECKAAIHDDNVEELKQLIDSNPDINFNHLWGFHFNWSLVHEATHNGKLKTLEYLLSLPEIDVNYEVAGMQTPLHTAVLKKQVGSVKLLLQHPGVNKWTLDFTQQTPFQISTRRKTLSVEIIKWWVVLDSAFSGVELKGRALETVRKVKCGRMTVSSIRHLATKLEKNPRYTRFSFCIDLNHGTERSLFLFALVILECDGFLKIKKEKESDLQRFFSMAGRLPIEIQMILCNMAYGSTGEIIKSKDLDMGLKKWTEMEKNKE